MHRQAHASVVEATTNEGWRFIVSAGQYNRCMGEHSLHSIVAGRVILLVVLALCAAGGCWEEIEYTGPDPAKIARREPRLPADRQPASTDESSARQESPPLATDTAPPELKSAPPASTDAASPTPGPGAKEAQEDADAPDFLDGLPTDESLIDDLEPEEAPVTETDTTAEPQPPESTPPEPALTTRLAAWKLGSKLTLAALAHDRRLVPDDVATWFAEASSAAETLGTSIAELPEPVAATERDGGSRRMHDYLFQQGQRIWHELTDRHGEDHAALFEVAVRSNVLLVLYEPGSSAVDALANSIREAAPRAKLPPELWQPLLDTLANQSPAAQVRSAVRRMHADVEQYLSREAQQ